MKRAILLVSNGPTTNYLYQAIASEVEIVAVIMESKESKRIFLKRKIKRHEFFKALGQIMFLVIVPRVLRSFSKRRITEIENEFSLIDRSIPNELLCNVTSVNNEKCSSILESEEYDIVIVNGTGIIRQNVLARSKAPFVNIHVGVTPEYRGVHGGYWALVNEDADNFGVTLHYIDKGVDTGTIIDQNKIVPREEDNFVTYPILQYACGLILLKKFLRKENLKFVVSYRLESGQYFHPTIFSYLKHRLLSGVK